MKIDIITNKNGRELIFDSSSGHIYVNSTTTTDEDGDVIAETIMHCNNTWICGGIPCRIYLDGHCVNEDPDFVVYNGDKYVLITHSDNDNPVMVIFDPSSKTMNIMSRDSYEFPPYSECKKGNKYYVNIEISSNGIYLSSNDKNVWINLSLRNKPVSSKNKPVSSENKPVSSENKSGPVIPDDYSKFDTYLTIAREYFPKPLIIYPGKGSIGINIRDLLGKMNCLIKKANSVKNIYAPKHVIYTILTLLSYFPNDISGVISSYV